MKAKLPLLLATLVSFASAQPVRDAWTRTLGYTINNQSFVMMPSLTLTPSGGVALVSRQGVTGAVVQHSRTAGTLTSEVTCATGMHPGFLPAVILAGASGSLYAIGVTPGATRDILVFKLTPQGTVIGSLQYDIGNGSTDFVRTAQIDAQENLYIAGTTKTAMQNTTPFVLKLNLNGIVQFKKVLPAQLVDQNVEALELAPNGNLAVVGLVQSATTQTYAWSLDASGTEIFYQPFLNPDGEYRFVDVAWDSQNRLYMAGHHSVQNVQRPRIAKMNDATVEWEKSDPNAFGSYANIQFQSNKLYGATYVGTRASSVRLNLDGEVERSTEYDAGAGYDYLTVPDLAVDPAGETYLTTTGYVKFSTDRVIILVKHSAAGTTRWVRTWQPTQSNGLFGGGVKIHPASGDLVVWRDIQVNYGTETALRVYRQAPVAIADGYVMKAGTTLVSPKLVTANDRQWQGATLTLEQPPANGTLMLQGNGKFTYTPNPGFTGKDTWKYRLAKPQLDQAVATVTMNVNP